MQADAVPRSSGRCWKLSACYPATARPTPGNRSKLGRGTSQSQAGVGYVVYMPVLARTPNENPHPNFPLVNGRRNPRRARDPLIGHGYSAGKLVMGWMKLSRNAELIFSLKPH